MTMMRFQTSRDDFPAPQSGFVLTHFLVVADQDRSREFYQSVFGATVVREGSPPFGGVEGENRVYRHVRDRGGMSVPWIEPGFGDDVR